MVCKFESAPEEEEEEEEVRGRGREDTTGSIVRGVEE
jgi:hypothetical protein